MTGFYKADLSDDVNQWEATSIVEKLGTPEEHEDRFWRKGPYGIEQDADGTFEAYVLVADTPFKIGGGFQSFQEAVMFLTSSMQSKTVPETPEEKSEQEAATESEGEKVPPAPEEADEGKEDAKDQEDADEATESTEKACDDEIKLGPEANSVGKSEDFEKSGDDGIEHRENVELEHPGVVNERHYIDNHALGKARLMADAPSLEAFEKSVGDFRSLMAYKNMDSGKMYADPGDPVPFVKADESTSFEDMSSFERARQYSYTPDIDEQYTHGRDYVGVKQRGQLDRGSAIFLPSTDALPAEERFRLRGGNTRYTAEGNPTGGRGERRHEGETKTGAVVSARNRNRNPGAIPLNDARVGESYQDPEAQKRRADSLLQKEALRRATDPNRPFEPDDGSVKVTGHIGTGGYGKKPVKTKTEEPAPKQAPAPVETGPGKPAPRKVAAKAMGVEPLGNMPISQTSPDFRDVPLAKQKADYEKDYRAMLEAKYAPKTEAPAEPAPAPAPTPEPEESAADEFDRLAGTKKAEDDPDNRSFREMLEFEKSRKNRDRGIPFSGVAMQGSHPYRELYRTVHMGGDRYDVRTDVFDPEIHKTDSQSKKL